MMAPLESLHMAPCHSSTMLWRELIEVKKQQPESGQLNFPPRKNKIQRDCKEVLIPFLVINKAPQGDSDHLI